MNFTDCFANLPSSSHSGISIQISQTCDLPNTNTIKTMLLLDMDKIENNGQKNNADVIRRNPTVKLFP